MKFASDSKAKKKFKSKINAVEKKLGNIESEIALEFIDWMSLNE